MRERCLLQKVIATDTELANRDPRKKFAPQKITMEGPQKCFLQKNILGRERTVK